MRMKSRHKQRGWIPLVIAAVTAAAAAKASADARRARLGAQDTALSQSDQEYARQVQFAQNAIQWRVEDAKKAGIHPLYALQGSGASYTPSAQQVFGGYDPSPTLALGSSLGRLGGAVADYYAGRANTDSGELMGPPDNLAPQDAAYSLPVSPYNETVGFPLQSNLGAPIPFGMVSGADKPSMAFWTVPEIGRVIAPDASNFSESLEGLESPIGQGLILYLNRGLGAQALKWLWAQMPSIPDLASRGLDYAVELGRKAAESALGVTIRRD